jgi:hypothetical protein
LQLRTSIYNKQAAYKGRQEQGQGKDGSGKGEG